MAISGEVEKLERRWSENPSGLTFAPLAEAYRKAGDQQRALEILEVGLAVHPDYVPALIVRGRCHLDAANLVEAEVAFQQVLARDPVNAIALKGMADLCEQGGRVTEAIERLELLLEVDRSNGEARADLTRLKSAPPVPAPMAPIALATDAVAASEGLPADERVAEEAAGEDAFMIENLSVDPMAGEDEPEPPAMEARLPWEPLEMPGWSQPEPERAEPVMEQAPPEEPAGEPDVAMSSSAPLEGLMTVSDPPEAPADAAAEPGLAPAWEWMAAAGAARAAEEAPHAESGPDQAETVSGPTELAEAPQMEQVEEAEGVSGAGEVVEDEAPAGVALVWAPEAVSVEEAAVNEVEAVLPVVQGTPAEPDAVQATTVDPRGPDRGEVAPEATPSESHMMNQPVPPESPEAADVPWPAVSSTDEEVVGLSAAEPVEPEPVEGAVAAEEPAAAEPADEPALIVTESMAELFLKQGHRELSLAVYRQLLERSPSSASLLDAISRLESEAAARETAEPGPTPPSRAASVTGGEPVGAMLQAVLSSPPPASASTVLPPAIEPVVAGEPARPGAEPLTLGQVFGDEPSMPPPAMETEPAQAGEPSFDEFFGASSGNSETTAPAGSARGPEGEDMRQFNDWLKGLKR
jgi:tetratricopeptide (TPR) repeat protein